jgi:hypothetical protein
VALALGSAPAVVLLGGTAVMSFDVGLRLGSAIAAAHFALLLLLLLPLIGQVRRHPAGTGRHAGARALPLVAVAVTAALLAAGLAVDRFDARHPRQTRLAYAMDAGTGEAVWGRPSAGAGGERWFGEAGWATEPAPRAPRMEAPSVTVTADQASGGKRTLKLRLAPTGQAPVVGLRVESPAGRIVVDGRELHTGAGFAYHAPSGPLEVSVVVRQGTPARIRIFEQAYDLSVVPGHRPVPGTIEIWPVTTVFREVSL